MANPTNKTTRKINTASSRSQAGTRYHDAPIEPFPVKKQRQPVQVPLPTQEQPRATQTEKEKGKVKEKKSKQKAKRNAQQPTKAAQRRRATRSEMRRRRRRRILLGVLLAVVLIGVGLALSVTVLFKLQAFRLENPDKGVPVQTGIYSEEAILSALNLPMGENLFQFSLKETQQRADEALPYLESIALRRSLPSTMVIQVTPAEESWALPTQAGWLVLSKGLKIMTQQAEQPQGLPAVFGVQPESQQPGKRLRAALPAAAAAASSAASSAQPEAAPQEPDKVIQHFTQIVQQLEQQNLLAGVTHLVLNEDGDAYFIYENRIKVIVGTYNNLDYKISVAGLLLHNETGTYLSASDKGVLDVSYQQDDGSIRPPFSPGGFDFPSVAMDTAGDSATVQEAFDIEPMPDIAPTE